MDVADRVEATTRRRSSSVADRMAPTVRDHSAEVVDREATVVRVDGVDLLEVEDEAEQAHEECYGLECPPRPKNLSFSPFGTYQWMCG